MRHRKRGRKFGRDCDHREALKRNLINALFTHERIITTEAKAKEYRPVAEKIITIARKAHAVLEAAGNDDAKKKEAAVRRLGYIRNVIRKIGKKKLYDRDGDGVLTPTDRIRTVIQKLFEDLGPRFATRPGGYTRILKLGKVRKGDAAPQVVWELMPHASVADSE